MDKDEKTRFLIINDYGTGGVWGCVWARTATEAAERFTGGRAAAPLPRGERRGDGPRGDGIIVFTRRPEWMSPEQEEKIARGDSLVGGPLVPRSPWLVPP